VASYVSLLLLKKYSSNYSTSPVSVAARSKAWVCGRSSAEIVVSNPTGAWMFFCCECGVLTGRGLYDELITRQEESYRLCCVVVCALETSWMREPWPTGGCCAKNKSTSSRSIKKYWTSRKWGLSLCLIIHILFVNFRDYNPHGTHLFFHCWGTGKRTSLIIVKFKSQFHLNF